MTHDPRGPHRTPDDQQESEELAMWMASLYANGMLEHPTFADVIRSIFDAISRDKDCGYEPPWDPSDDDFSYALSDPCDIAAGMREGDSEGGAPVWGVQLGIHQHMDKSRGGRVAMSYAWLPAELAFAGGQALVLSGMQAMLKQQRRDCDYPDRHDHGGELGDSAMSAAFDKITGALSEFARLTEELVTREREQDQ